MWKVPGVQPDLRGGGGGRDAGLLSGGGDGVHTEATVRSGFDIVLITKMGGTSQEAT